MCNFIIMIFLGLLKCECIKKYRQAGGPIPEGHGNFRFTLFVFKNNYTAEEKSLLTMVARF